MAIALLEDLGVIKKEGAKQGRRMFKVQCDCGTIWDIQATQYKAGYTNWCKPCGIKHRNYDREQMILSVKE